MDLLGEIADQLRHHCKEKDTRFALKHDFASWVATLIRLAGEYQELVDSVERNIRELRIDELHVHLERLPPEQVLTLQRRRQTANPNQAGANRPIIIFETGHSRFVIDGNNRVGRYLACSSTEPLPAIVIRLQS